MCLVYELLPLPVRVCEHSLFHAIASRSVRWGFAMFPPSQVMCARCNENRFSHPSLRRVSKNAQFLILSRPSRGCFLFALRRSLARERERKSKKDNQMKPADPINIAIGYQFLLHSMALCILVIKPQKEPQKHSWRQSEIERFHIIGLAWLACCCSSLLSHGKKSSQKHNCM